jgi:hypothetical protein
MGDRDQGEGLTSDKGSQQGESKIGVRQVVFVFLINGVAR